LAYNVPLPHIPCQLAIHENVRLSLVYEADVVRRLALQHDRILLFDLHPPQACEEHVLGGVVATQEELRLLEPLSFENVVALP
jgi:hypothetical protein